MSNKLVLHFYCNNCGNTWEADAQEAVRDAARRGKDSQYNPVHCVCKSRDVVVSTLVRKHGLPPEEAQAHQEYADAQEPAG